MYILLSYNSSGATDCSQVDTLLRFIAWIQLNDNVRSLHSLLTRAGMQ
jgi:hypothetical protein